jgi:alginate O-acetyltransferase complex protein AlgI
VTNLIFSGLIFLCIFLPLTTLLYYIIRDRRWRNGLLIAASLVFYAWGEPRYVILLLVCSLFNYFCGLSIEKSKAQNKKKAKLILSVSLNIFVLFFFKYTGFLIENLNLLSGWTVQAPDIYLPVGISFYTFKAISYVVDIYRGKVPAQKSHWKFLLYISLFHHLVAGPIIRYEDIANDIDCREETPEGLRDGVRRFIIGLAKKVILSNTAAEIAGTFLDGDISRLSVAGAWLGIILFAFRIYFDFSGYSDMAIGLGKMFGFNYTENFNYPYISKSLTEFWRRWHISLGTFFRDYVYIPLGGNRKCLIRNLLVVWFLTGLWHGASWNFILWGVFNFVLIVIEKKLLRRFLERIPAFFSRVYFVFVILVGWTFFYFTDTTRLFVFLGALFGSGGRSFISPDAIILIENNCVFIVICILACMPVLKYMSDITERKTEERSKLAAGIQNIGQPFAYTMVFIVSLLFLVSQTYNPFLYFQF